MHGDGEGNTHSKLKSTHECKHCYTPGKRNLAKCQVESDGVDWTHGEHQVKGLDLVWVLRSGEWGRHRGGGIWQGRQRHEQRWEPRGTVRTSRSQGRCKVWGTPLSFLRVTPRERTMPCTAYPVGLLAEAPWSAP